MPDETSLSVVPSNENVREYWEQEPCGTDRAVVGNLAPHTREWFEEVERFRSDVEGYIHSVAQFTRHHGQTILEVGVGAGTDHLQWARAGCHCHGVDLTDAAIETTRERLALYGLESDLRRIDAESLPFPKAETVTERLFAPSPHDPGPEDSVNNFEPIEHPAIPALTATKERKTGEHF